MFNIFKPLVISCGCTVRFVSALVGNPEIRVSYGTAHIFVVEIDARSVNQRSSFCHIVTCKMNPCNSFTVMQQCSNHPGAECRYG